MSGEREAGRERRSDPRSAKPYQCRRCGSGEFFRVNNGRHRSCLPCRRERGRLYYQNSPETKASRAARAKVYRDSERGQVSRKATLIKKRYGLTREAYQAMVAQQGGACAICGGANPNGHALYVDHCHKTDAVRALLCLYCNHGLGSFRDNPTNMRRAADYIEKFAARAALQAMEGGK